MTDTISFRSRDGLLLEGATDAAPGPRAALVLCHPHPKMGGTMNAPLLLALRDGLVEAGWAVLRFNFRGIGASEGESSTGEAEVADALGALDEARARWTGLPLAIAGWSFGGAVALRVLDHQRSLAACAVIAPAVEPKPGITAGAPPPNALSGGVPILVVIGENDDQVSPASARAWAEKAGASFVEMAGANHFFWARYERLAEEVVRFLDEKVSP